MKKNKSCFLLFLFVGTLVFSCNSNSKDLRIDNHQQDEKPTIHSIEALLPDTFLKKGNCKNILLIKKNDCLACEQMLARFVSDSTITSNTLFINETIRKIELTDYYKKRPFLNNKKGLLFDSELITNICKTQNINFSSSVMLILNKNNQVIEVGLLKELVGNVAFFDKVCKD
ncbi:MAG: hypothetical protein K0B10_08175 [Vicingaceae bacterium]|nr:hypothetical protein [Vicingaceae bacterium]